MIFWLKGVRTLAFALPLYYKDIFVVHTVMLRFALIRHSVLRAEDVFDTDRVTLWDFRINFRSGALDVINDHTVANKFGWFRRHILKLLQIVFGVQWVLGISRAHGFEFPRRLDRSDSFKSSPCQWLYCAALVMGWASPSSPTNISAIYQVFVYLATFHVDF